MKIVSLACAGAFALAAVGAAAAPLPAPRRGGASGEPCAAHDPLRQPFFGDLHVHSALSLDASTQGTVNRPADAYRFARGERLGIQPYDADGRALRHVRLARPLDFAAVTDHAELLGEWNICNSEGLEGHDSWICRIYRTWPRVAFFQMNYWANTARRFDFCGEDGAVCLEAARAPWREIRDAARDAYDRSASCGFTTFVGYEWTGAFGAGNNAHRNVIFANQHVPALPASYVDTPSPPALWAALREECTEAGTGCDAVVIPHNSNLGNGLMFRTLREDGEPIDVTEARGRAELERLAEVMQHKGSSECMRGIDTEDELCGFETLAMSNFIGRYFGALADPPKPRQFLRHILREGLLEEARLGVNPFQYGLIASTDTHLAAAGAVAEEGYPGHGGAGTPAGEVLPEGLPDAVDFNPGGLAVLWAEENSRESLFAAMRRREAYGTSGPRIALRFFAGFGLPDNLCASPDFASLGYAAGVPMGGDLVRRPGDPGTAPRFAVAALRDPGAPGQPGVPLERIQIVKGWIEDGTPREAVYDVAGEPVPGSDLATCEPPRAGRDPQSSVFTDPDFDAGERAYWYARVLEPETCRWHWRTCRANGVDCSAPGGPGEGFEACCDPEVPKTVRERAWSSPIWYTPPSAGAGAR